MTLLQKLVLCTGLAAILIMMIIPPNIVAESSGDSSSISIVQVIRYQPFFSKTVKKIQYPRLFLQCFIASTITVGLLLVCGRTQKSAARRARELADVSKKLHAEITDREQVEKSLRQQNNKLAESNEKLQQKIAEHTKAEKNFQQQYAELAQTNENLQREIAKLNAAEKELQEYQDLLNQYFEQ